MKNSKQPDFVPGIFHRWFNTWDENFMRLHMSDPNKDNQSRNNLLSKNETDTPDKYKGTEGKRDSSDHHLNILAENIRRYHSDDYKEGEDPNLRTFIVRKGDAVFHVDNRPLFGFSKISKGPILVITLDGPIIVHHFSKSHTHWSDEFATPKAKAEIYKKAAEINYLAQKEDRQKSHNEWMSKWG